MAVQEDVTTPPAGTSGTLLTNGAVPGERFVAFVGEPSGPGWTAADELFGPGLPTALEAVGSRRGTPSPAVAGALLVEQYAHRVVGPVLAAFHEQGRVVYAGLAAVRVELDRGALGRVAFAGPVRAGGPDAVRARRAVGDDLIGGNLEPAARAVHRHTRVGLRVLRGAVANAVATAFLHLSWPREDGAHYLPVLREFLAENPVLDGLIGTEAIEEQGRTWMYTDRRACCLAFRTESNRSREVPYCATCPVLPGSYGRGLFREAARSYLARHPELAPPG